MFAYYNYKNENRGEKNSKFIIIYKLGYNLYIYIYLICFLFFKISLEENIIYYEKIFIN